MPSFDIVSEVNEHELTNAVDQTNRDVTGRFDFKGSDAKVEREKDALVLHAQNEFQIKQMKDILHQRLAKRGIDIQALEEEALEETGQRARQRIKVRQGIDKELAKKIVALIKDSKLKVQASVQGEQVRVTGKKRDDLQEAIALLRGASLGLPLQYQNFRD
ncbi:MAG: YajQ family cyclic di-GMP-binding protein [Thiohalomonadaceae bacterium]